MSKGIIELFTPEGEVKDYKLFSARLPEFLKAYPKNEGYRVTVDTSDTLSSKPGLLKLYEAAIAAGKSPADVGLPALPAGDVVVFKASLLDKEGRVLECASALRVIRQYKDWEKGETAARQRLIAALGFGGDCFDMDEMSDIEDQGMTTSESKGQTTQAQGDPAPEQQPQQTEKQETVKPDAAAEAQPATTTEQGKADESAGAGTDVDSTDSAPADDAAKKAPQGDSAAEEIPARLIRQIQHQANLKGKEIPEFNSVREAKQALKELMRS